MHTALPFLGLLLPSRPAAEVTALLAVQQGIDRSCASPVTTVHHTTGLLLLLL